MEIEFLMSTVARFRMFAVGSMALAAVALASPVSAADPLVAQAEPAPSGPVSFLISGDPAELAAYETVVAAFEQAYPTIDVKVTHIPGDSDYLQRLANDFAAGTPADVVFINYRRYASFAAKGVLQPLGPYLATSSIVHEADFFRQAIDAFRWGGQVVCIPQNVSSLIVYYNKKLFDDAGLAYPVATWTWDDFLASAQALTKDLDGDGKTDQYGLGTQASIIRVAPFIWQNGGDLVNPLEPSRLTVDTRAAAEAIQWFVDLQVTHHVVPNAIDEAAEDSETRFLNGRTAMFLQSRRPVPAFREITAFDWDVAPLPMKEQAATIIHSDGYCMPSAAPHKDAAWALIEFANSAAGQAIIAGTGRTVPSLTSVANSPAFLDPATKPANSQAFLDVIPQIRSVPVLPTWLDIEELAGAELERAFYGDATVVDAIKLMIDRTLPFFSGAEG